jgi:transposase-like protein
MLDIVVAFRDRFCPWSQRGEKADQVPGWQVEHRYRAVMEVLDGSPVSEVAVRYGVSRQSVYS